MTEHQPTQRQDQAPSPDAQGQHEEHEHVDYKKIYFTLLVLLVVSVAGPFLEILWVTLITAFGIALVKANLVVQNFMHLRWEKRLVKWVLVSSVALMALFVAGVAPDVMRHEGQNWVNVAAREAVGRGLADDEHAETEEQEEEADAVTEPVVVNDPAVFNAQNAYNLTCATCHGQAGDGAGLAGGALNPPPADFTDPAFWATRDTDRIFTVIKDGAAAVGGSPLMVGWSFTYDDDQVQALTDYVVGFRPGGL